MRKSTVLKDGMNRPAGYMLALENGILCRVRLDVPAKLAVIFADGTQRLFDLDGLGQEQRFSCEAAQVRGCFVFREEELLLVSDEAMRSAFEKLLCGRKPDRQDERKTESRRQETPKEERVQAKEYAFVQRRWPPPPGWNTAIYRQGRWQETESAAGDAAHDVLQR